MTAEKKMKPYEWVVLAIAFGFIVHGLYGLFIN